jgi:ubiquinol-cytochrome c reductase iron-sulfur subunit
LRDTDPTEPMKPPAQPRRRDLLVTSAFALAGAGGLLALWPFVSALTVAPRDDADAVSLDLDAIPAGTTQQVIWRGKPFIVRHRTADEAARSLRQVTRVDRYARNDNLEPLSEAGEINRLVPGKPRYLIMSAVCTKGDCIIRDVFDDGVGWFCPCCASRYDFSGRVVAGPAPQNLPVPRYKPRDGRWVIGAR